MSSPTSPLYFTGASKYSTDLQTILTRAVNIASVPLKQLQNQQADLIGKKQLLTDLRGGVSGMATALNRLGAIGDNQGLTASSSNAARVSVSLSGTAAPGYHTITNITSLARAASGTTTAGVASADAATVASGDSMQLVVGSKKYSIDTSSGKNNLNSIRDQINNLNAGVSATVLNTGTGNSPYYLAITANATGSNTLELRNTAEDAASNVLTTDNPGSDADFYLDGLHIVKHDNVVNDVLPGVTFTIQQKTDGDAVTLSLTSERGSLANALNGLVSSYNSLADKANAQIGKTAGLLSGQSIIGDVKRALRSLASYTGSSGAVQSLADLGIEFDRAGVMSFNQDKFYSLSNAQVSAAFGFLKTGTGLATLASQFTSMSDPVTGAIRLQQDGYDAADRRISDQVAQLTDRISAMQSSMLQRLQLADTLLANLESQQSLISASVDSVNYSLYGRKSN